MKIFISADIEGVVGTSRFEECREENTSLYNPYAIQMSKEVAAACQGAFSAGAKEIVIKDSHGNGRNIIQEYLPRGTKLIKGSTSDPFSMIGGIDKSYDAILFVGYHDAAGSNKNPLAHTISSKIVREVKINGSTVAEIDIFLLGAAYLGIPTAFVSGDSETCNRAKNLNEKIHTVSTKEGIGYSVLSIHPEDAQILIEETVLKSLQMDLNQYKVQLPQNFIIDIEYNKHHDAKANSHYPGATLLNPFTIRYESNDYYEVLRLLFFTI